MAQLTNIRVRRFVLPIATLPNELMEHIAQGQRYAVDDLLMGSAPDNGAHGQRNPAPTCCF